MAQVGSGCYTAPFRGRGDFTDLMGRAAYGRPGSRLRATV